MPPVASATVTSWPESAAVRAIASPTTPAPITRTCIALPPSCFPGYRKRLYNRRRKGRTMAENVVRVCAQADIAPETVKAFEVGDSRLAVYNIAGQFYVTDDECTHAAASLADGMLEGDVIECCMHMGSFHVPTGNVVAPPCEVSLRTYKVVLEGDDVV